MWSVFQCNPPLFHFFRIKKSKSSITNSRTPLLRYIYLCIYIYIEQIKRGLRVLIQVKVDVSKSIISLVMFDQNPRGGKEITP